MAYPSPVGVTSKAFTGGTITIGFADLPAGTAIGDSILVCFFTDGGSSSTQSTPSGWTARSGASTDQSGWYHISRPYDARVLYTTVPATWTFTGHTSGTAVICTLSPGYAYVSGASGGSPRNSNPVPGTWGSGTGDLPDLPVEGTMIVMASVHNFNGGQMTTLNTANSFTEIADIGAGSPGNPKVAAYSTNSPVTDKTLPLWNKTVGFGGAGVVAFAWALGTPYSPLPVLTHTGAMTT